MKTMNGKYNKIYSRPAAMSMVEDDGKIWMALLNRNGICEVDIKTKQARICGIFEKESLAEELLYSCVEKVDHYLVFAPGYAKEIAIYNLYDSSIKYIPLKKVNFSCKVCQSEAKFWNILRYQSNVYLVGYSYPAIVKINMDSMNVTYITDWVGTLEEKEIPKGDDVGYFSDGFVIDGETALLPINHMQAVLELNLKLDCTAIRKLDISAGGIGGLSSVDGKNIWLVGRGHGSNQVFCWKRQTNEIKTILISDEDENVRDLFFAPLCTETKVFLMPVSATGSYEIRLDGEVVTKTEKMEIPINNTKVPLCPWWKTMASKVQDERLTYLTGEDLKWHEYYVETGEHISYYVHIKEDARDIERYLEALYQETKNGILLELGMPFEFFIDKVLKAEKQKEDEEKRFCLSGKRIYNQICKEI